MSLTLEKIDNPKIDPYIDECYKIQDFIDSLNKDNVKESKDKLFLMCDKLMTEIENSDIDKIIKDNILKQIQEELLNYYTTKYYVMVFD